MAIVINRWVRGESLRFKQSGFARLRVALSWISRGLLAPALAGLALIAGGPTARADGIPAVPPPQDLAYSGAIDLRVDATDLDRRIFRTVESIPVGPGPLTLLYPQWLPGNHAPSGPIEALAGLTITGGGRRLAWTRDPVNMYAFHVEVPAGVTALAVELQFASPENGDQGRIVATPEIVGLQWEKALVYPAGYYSSRILVNARLTLPGGWKFGTALTPERREGDTVIFRPISLEMLVDSPVFAGKYFSRLDLAPGAKVPVWLDVVADSPDELELKPDQLAAHRRLVQQAVALFGSRHFDHYDFLLSISDDFTGIGLEHHRSSEDGVRRGYFKEWDRNEPRRSLLPHEMTHSWNGKFRRPADLWTPNFNTPMRDSLLWVYEGMTEYWGEVLAARSGLWSAETARESLAVVAAGLQEHRPGRDWRNLEDTTNQPIVTRRGALSFVSWQRTEDYYREGQLVWFDVDTKLRELTGGRRSLDDFARAFLGVEDGRYAPLTYTFDEVVRTLNGVAAHDWAGFLRTRLDRTGAGAPLDGLARSGWKLVFKPEPSAYLRKLNELSDVNDQSYSLGCVVDQDARLAEVVWGSPAFAAGLATNATLVAVNGRAYKAALLVQAIRDGQTHGTPIELIVRSLDRYRTVTIPYTGGLRYPTLERVAGRPDMLAEILRPRPDARP
jgi:predicted metalloprotease with PDZ domain